MPQPLVSVIVPAYNAAGFISRCVESITSQSYPELEILLLNDGSTDDTLAVCRALAANDHRIALVDKTNTGAADTRNQGIALAHGKYIQFVDSDDWIERRCMKGCMKLRPLQALQLRRLRGMRSTRITTKDRTSVRRRNRKLPARQKIF